MLPKEIQAHIDAAAKDLPSLLEGKETHRDVCRREVFATAERVRRERPQCQVTVTETAEGFDIDAQSLATGEVEFVFHRSAIDPDLVRSLGA